ncbi:MAG: FAD-dependent oxidoreductase [Methanobacteriota archaeon]|nr:MAG: FAD-dependent oxidoreductase [Euryarchaeota archaeon]
MEPWDVTIVGGGVLGTSFAYWLAARYEGRIAVLEKEANVAAHTSRRNTGVVHRPFYLDPQARRVFARCAQVAYGMWKGYAERRRLPWRPIGTFEVATRPEGVGRLDKYFGWGLANGMGEDELQVLTAAEVRRHEPNVRSHGAIWSKTDTAVDYESFTKSVREDAEAAGARFLLGSEVAAVDVKADHLEVRFAAPDADLVYVDPRRRIRARISQGAEPLRTRFLLNCAGGNSIDLAHRLGVGLEYTDLHFRGEYWEIDPASHFLASRNIYTVPRHPDLPFLDPHWIIRADGRREIGPNAVPVAGPYTYRGFGNPSEIPHKIFESPLRNKLRLLVNPDFLTLAAEEWASSISKRVMTKRAREFLPALKEDNLIRPGTAGVRASVVDRRGIFMKEAIELAGPHSYHITNYNSPGATGAPAYAAWTVLRLARSGLLDHLKPRATKRPGPWDFDAVTAAIEAPAAPPSEAMVAVAGTGPKQP